jgi:hypothetical protein
VGFEVVTATAVVVEVPLTVRTNGVAVVEKPLKFDSPL